MASNETSEVPKQPKVPTGDEDEKIAYPLGEVYRHTMLRGAGLGSFAATVVGTPFLLYRGARGVLLFKRLGKISLLGTGVGAGAIAFKTYKRLQDQTDIQVWDRAYRLRHNEKQVRVDMWTYGGLVLGGLAGSLLTAPRLAAAVYGGSVGCGIAFVIGMATNLPKK